MLVARLLNEHTKLRFLGNELVAIVSGPQPCDLDELARRRWDLARMVHQHLAFEERHLFCRFESDLRADVREASAKARRRVELLHARYDSHVARWTAAEVVSRWPEFQSAVGFLVKQMAHSIDREETELFPLLSSDPAPRLDWQPGMRNWAGDGVAMQPLITGVAQLEIDRRPRAAEKLTVPSQT